MPSFTVRVELHEATWTDYETLHDQMGAEGFRRTIRSDDGITYHLPTAEYDMTGLTERSDVLDKAKTAAARTRKNFGVLVTESNGRTWFGLPQVR
jgi:hypothetical protein